MTTVERPKHQKLLTRPEAAEFLGVSVRALEVWAATGRYGLRFIKTGRLVKYRLSDLEAWLDSRTVIPINA